MSLIDFIEKDAELSQAAEIIFFAGSFNPWHDGHTSCLKLLKSNAPIIVIPDHNPYKELRRENHQELDRIASHLESIKKHTFLFDHFYKQYEKNPSYVWLEKLRVKYPKKIFSLLVGFDTFMSIDRWIHSEIVFASLNKIYIASRNDDPTARLKQEKNLYQLAQHLTLKFIGNHDFEHLSSTEIRKQWPQ